MDQFYQFYHLYQIDQLYDMYMGIKFFFLIFKIAFCLYLLLLC